MKKIEERGRGEGRRAGEGRRSGEIRAERGRENERGGGRITRMKEEGNMGKEKRKYIQGIKKKGDDSRTEG